MSTFDIADLSDEQAVILLNAVHSEPEQHAPDHFEAHQTPELDKEHTE